jgi:ATP-dependent RNA helicase RhlE
MPEPIAELAAQFLSDPLRVAVTPPSTTAERVEQAVIHVDHSRKQDLLHALLADESISRALVFARTKHGADRVVRKLQDAGFAADAIHGNKSQGQRERALDAFKKGKARVLVATEIAARGIDVDDVTHVINFDLPNVPEQYVHRIGRTARAARSGMAISFCAPDERAYLKDIARLTKQDVPVMTHELSLPTPKADERTPKPRPQGQKQPRQPQRGRAPARHHASDAHGKPQRKPSHARNESAKRGDDRTHNGGSRDQGDRRDRKGNAVWSNSGPAPKYRKQRRPIKV